MINHPQQKYVADPSMARSNIKKKIKEKSVWYLLAPWTFWFLFVLLVTTQYPYRKLLMPIGVSSSWCA